MASGYTKIGLDEAEDSAAKFGFGEIGEARFANTALDTEQTGLSFHRLRPNARQAFGHRHEAAEEVYVVIGGSGRARLGDDEVELQRLDAIRIDPQTMRALEAGPDGLEILCFGARHAEDRGEVASGWWGD